MLKNVPVGLLIGLNISIWLWVLIFISRKAKRISLLYRKNVNPTFPVSGAEVWGKIANERSLSNKMQILVSTLVNRLKILETRRSSSGELNKLLKFSRGILIIWSVVIVIDLSLIFFLALKAPQ
jgi:hypothetical protein